MRKINWAGPRDDSSKLASLNSTGAIQQWDSNPGHLCKKWECYTPSSSWCCHLKRSWCVDSSQPRSLAKASKFLKLMKIWGRHREKNSLKTCLCSRLKRPERIGFCTLLEFTPYDQNVLGLNIAPGVVLFKNHFYHSQLGLKTGPSIVAPIPWNVSLAVQPGTNQALKSCWKQVLTNTGLRSAAWFLK